MKVKVKFIIKDDINDISPFSSGDYSELEEKVIRMEGTATRRINYGMLYMWKL